MHGLRAVPLDELMRLIRPSGFATRKAPRSKHSWPCSTRSSRLARQLAATPTDALRPRLLALPGVGPETADAILLYALGHAAPMADEYLRRIAERHRLIDPPPGRDRQRYESLAA